MEMFTLIQESNDDARARKLESLPSTNNNDTDTVSCNMVEGTAMNSADDFEMLGMISRQCQRPACK